MFGILLVEFKIIDFLNNFGNQLLSHLLGTCQAHVGQIKLHLCLGMGDLSICMGSRILLGQLLNGVYKRHLKHSFTKQPIEFFITHQIGLLQLGHANLLGDQFGGHLSVLNYVLFNNKIINFVKRHVSNAMQLQVIGFYGLILIEFINILLFYCLPPIFDYLDLLTESWRFTFVLRPFGRGSWVSVCVFRRFGMLSMSCLNS